MDLVGLVLKVVLDIKVFIGLNNVIIFYLLVLFLCIKVIK